MLTLMFIAWSIVYASRSEALMTRDRRVFSLREKLELAPRVLPFLLLVAGILYVLYGGVATPSEAAGVGAMGALLLAVMSRHPAHADYTLQTFLYISRLAAQEDYSSALNFGLRPDQINVIGAMNIQQMHELVLSIQSEILQLSINPESLDTALRISQSRSAQRSLILKMIKGGASCRMMHALFGLSNADHAEFRKWAGLSNQGRPEMPSEALQDKIWQSWTVHNELEIKQRLITVHEDTQVDLSSIWILIQSWLTNSAESSNLPAQ